MPQNQLLIYNSELLKLSLMEVLDEGDIDNAFKSITQELARILDVTRVSIWLTQEDNAEIRCADLYDQNTGLHSQGAILRGIDFPAYFKAMLSKRTICADNAMTHPATYEFTESYLKPQNIKSMMDAPLRVRGELVGVVCCESVGYIRKWSLEDETFVGSISDIVARVIQAKERKDALSALEAINTNLEDIVRMKTEELMVEKARSLHSAKMASLGEMAGSIAHEINNPLAIISSYVDIIMMDLDPESKNASAIIGYLNKLDLTCDRIAKIVKGLRFFARDAVDDTTSVSSLQEIVSDTLGLCQEKFLSHSCKLIQEGSLEGLLLNCQSVNISQALLNLLNNSFDAIAHLPNKEIKLSTLVKDNYVLLKISDNGPGIPKELRQNIMKPFFTTKPVGKGTGLGLSIVKGIVEKHQGEFYLDTDCAATTFVIKLPLVDGFYRVAV